MLELKWQGMTAFDLAKHVLAFRMTLVNAGRAVIHTQRRHTVPLLVGVIITRRHQNGCLVLVEHWKAFATDHTLTTNM